MELAGHAATLATALEATALATWVRTSGWAYPLVNLVHLLGLTLLIGPIGLLDLRLLGFGRRFALCDVSTALTPYAVTGLLLLIGSGVLLFSADASPLHRNPMLQIKLSCIALALANALAFRRIWAHRRCPVVCRRYCRCCFGQQWVLSVGCSRIDSGHDGFQRPLLSCVRSRLSGQRTGLEDSPSGDGVPATAGGPPNGIDF
jgi:hypothetical protein